jgi:hypothetical protein
MGRKEAVGAVGAIGRLTGSAWLLHPLPAFATSLKARKSWFSLFESVRMYSKRNKLELTACK